MDNETIFFYWTLQKMLKKKPKLYSMRWNREERRIDLWYWLRCYSMVQEIRVDKGKSLKRFFDLWSDKHKKLWQQKTFFCLGNFHNFFFAVFILRHHRHLLINTSQNLYTRSTFRLKGHFWEFLTPFLMWSSHHAWQTMKRRRVRKESFERFSL